MNLLENLPSLQQTDISWWRYLIRGVVMLLLGLTLIMLTLLKPDVMIFHARDSSWLPLCGFIVLAIGILECFDAFITRQSKDFYLHLQNGLLDVVVAGLLVFSSGDDPARLSLLISAFMIIKGSYRIVLSYALTNINVTLTRLGAGISILLGLMIWMEWPTAAGWFLAFCLSTEIVFRGWAIILFARWLKTQQKINI